MSLSKSSRKNKPDPLDLPKMDLSKLDFSGMDFSKMEKMLAGMDLGKMMQTMMPMLQSFQGLQTGVAQGLAESILGRPPPDLAPQVATLEQSMLQVAEESKPVMNEFKEVAEQSGLFDQMNEFKELPKIEGLSQIMETVKESIVDPVQDYVVKNEVPESELWEISSQIEQATKMHHKSGEKLSFDVTKSAHVQPVLDVVASGMEAVLKSPLFQDPQFIGNLIGSFLPMVMANASQSSPTEVCQDAKKGEQEVVEVEQAVEEVD